MEADGGVENGSSRTSSAVKAPKNQLAQQVDEAVKLMKEKAVNLEKEILGKRNRDEELRDDVRMLIESQRTTNMLLQNFVKQSNPTPDYVHESTPQE